MTNPDYNLYMDTQQAINLEILRRFEELKIDFAYPVQVAIQRVETPLPVAHKP